MADAGVKVTAVDRHKVSKSHKNIEFICADIYDWIPEQKEVAVTYDAVLLANVLQFLDPAWVGEQLIPFLKEKVVDGGYVGIESFRKDPEPPFKRKIDYFYNEGTLQDYFSEGFSIQWVDEYDDIRPDLATGAERKFFLVGMVVQRVVQQ